MPRGTASADLRNQLDTLSELGVVGNLSDVALLERTVHDRDGASKRYRVDPKETLLLRVMESKAVKGVDVDGYPRGEVVVVKY